MNEEQYAIDIEWGKAGLYYGTSKQVPGLLVTGTTIQEVQDKVPNAIRELRAAREEYLRNA